MGGLIENTKPGSFDSSCCYCTKKLNIRMILEFFFFFFMSLISYCFCSQKRHFALDRLFWLVSNFLASAISFQDFSSPIRLVYLRCPNFSFCFKFFHFDIIYYHKLVYTNSIQTFKFEFLIPCFFLSEDRGSLFVKGRMLWLLAICFTDWILTGKIIFSWIFIRENIHDCFVHKWMFASCH